MTDLSLFAPADALGRAVMGTTSPNPPVGCVLFDATGQREIGRGATQPPGGPHAEVMAVRDAQARGEELRGAWAVVTLEPCNHTGRTGPCSHALLGAGIARVDYLFADPNPLAVGGGDYLRNHGVDVHGPYCNAPVASDKGSPSGDTANEDAEGPQWIPQWSIEPWLVATLRGRPHVTLKMASTVDGFVAATDKTSQWITSAAARQHVHDDRRRRDAIVVGTGTVAADNPRLTARAEDGSTYPEQPLRVIMGERAVADDAAIYGTPGLALHVRTRDVEQVLAELWSRGIVDVLVEGGPHITGAFLRGGLYDAVQLYQAPALMLAGSRSVEIDDELQTSISDIQRLTPRSVETFGPDVLWTLTR